MNRSNWRGLEIFHLQDRLVKSLEHCLKLRSELINTGACHCDGISRTGCREAILGVVDLMNAELGSIVIQAANYSVVPKMAHDSGSSCYSRAWSATHIHLDLITLMSCRKIYPDLGIGGVDVNHAKLLIHAHRPDILEGILLGECANGF